MILNVLLTRLQDHHIILHRRGLTEKKDNFVDPLLSDGTIPALIILSGPLGACKVKYTEKGIVLSEFSSKALMKRIREVKRNEKSIFSKLDILK